MPPSISVVLPMYNEESYIRRSIRAATTILRDLEADYEIIIVDDASTDATGAIADELAASDPRLRVLHHQENRTLGRALRTGFAAAGKELVLYADADLPFDMQELGRAVRLLDYHGADVLSAYRFDRTSEGLRRMLYSFVYNRLVRSAFGLWLKDVNFGFKLFRRTVLEGITLRSEGSFIDVEFLVRARNAGARIIQIGVDYFPRSRGVSTLSSWRVIRRILAEMWSLRRELRES